jgi:hypothetical protein
MDLTNVPEHTKAGLIAVEVSDAMIEAGFEVLAHSGIADDYSGADKLLVADIYRAMQNAASSLP